MIMNEKQYKHSEKLYSNISKAIDKEKAELISSGFKREEINLILTPYLKFAKEIRDEMKIYKKGLKIDAHA